MNEGLDEIYWGHKKLNDHIEEEEWAVGRDKGHYSDPTHFIYELLQNAEDVNASWVHFELNDNVLVCKHNGRPFTWDDVKAITKPGVSTKEGSDKIGKFGIGFDSVFNISDTPIILSRNYAFKIVDDYLPVSVTVDPEIVKEATIFKFPFNAKLKNDNKTHDLILNGFNKLDADKIIFLNNIERISWSVNAKKGAIVRSVEPFKGIDQIKKVKIIDEFQPQSAREFLTISQNCKISEDTAKVTIGFRVVDNEGQMTFLKEIDAKVYTYFPTERAPNLNFKIQAPFQTTPNRENIKQGSAVNDILLEEIENLIESCINLFKLKNILTLNFLSIFPFDRNKSEDYIYQRMVNKVIATLKSGKYIPTTTNEFEHIDEVAISKAKYVSDLFDGEDLRLLFGVRNWVDSGINDSDLKELKKFLTNECGVHIKTFRDFIDSLLIENVREKPVNWFIDLYKQLLGVNSLWKYDSAPIRQKPIIKLASGKVIPPFDDEGIPIVYLPSGDKSRFDTVDRSILEDAKAKEFLVELGLSVADICAEVNELVIPKYQAGYFPTEQEYLEDLRLILLGYKRSPQNKLFKKLKEVPFLRCYDINTAEFGYSSPSQTYYESDELKEYFEFAQGIKVVQEDVFKNFETQLVEDFLNVVEVVSVPRTIEFDPEFSNERLEKLRNYSKSSRPDEEVITDKVIDGLENVISNMTFDKSLILWDFLQNILQSNSTWWLFNGSYEWFYRHDQRVTFESKLYLLLTNSEWLYTTNKTKVRPRDTKINELHKKYNIEERGEELAIKLGVLTDEMTNRERQLGVRYVSMTDEKYNRYLEFEEQDLLNRQKNDFKNDEKEKDSWEPQPLEKIDFENIIINKAKPLKYYDDVVLSPKSNLESHEWTPPLAEDINFEVTKESKNKKIVGYHGEKIVFQKLKEEYANTKCNVIWHNKDSDTGEGYDITVEKYKEDGNSTIIKFIEVKSSLNAKSELFNVSARQWSTLRELFELGRGDQYSIVTVTNLRLGSPTLFEINNPYKLWLEGKLYAQPIGIKLPPDF